MNAALSPPLRLSPASLAAVTLAHVLGIALLLGMHPPVLPVRIIEPLSVSLIPMQAKPSPPTPAAAPAQPAPILAAARPAPQPLADIAKPAPVAEPAPLAQPTPMPPAGPAQPAAQAEAPTPAPLAPPTPPRPADYLTNPKPPYPALSRRLGEEGMVRLHILVNADGSVARLEIARSSGYPRLDESAARTVQSSWKFEPARQDGKPVAAWVIVPIQFTLRS